MLFYSGEVYFIIYDGMNDMADFIVNIIRTLMRFARNYRERLRMQSLFELYENLIWEWMKLV